MSGRLGRAGFWRKGQVLEVLRHLYRRGDSSGCCRRRKDYSPDCRHYAMLVEMEKGKWVVARGGSIGNGRVERIGEMEGIGGFECGSFEFWVESGNWESVGAAGSGWRRISG